MRKQLSDKAKLMARIRAFMQQRGVTEVVTPCISAYPVSDLNIESVGLATIPKRFLRTSPESFHKSLLSQGSGDLYELGPVFRADEFGRHHRGEFLMLEYYRIGLTWQDLALEVIELINELAKDWHDPWSHQWITWDQASESALGFNLRTASREQCLSAMPDDASGETWSQEAIVDFLFATRVQASFDPSIITVVHDFPADQAALAKLSDDGQHAKRFEVFLQGVELANGYQELTDPIEQKKRFEQEAASRQAIGRSVPSLDDRLIAALSAGLPDCSGVAIGVDRLMMVILGLDSLDELLPLSDGHALTHGAMN